MVITLVFGTSNPCSIQGVATKYKHKMTIGEQIKNIRKEKGLTQKELAHRVGLSWQTISNVENNKYTSLSTLSKIIEGLGVNIQIF